MLKLWTSEDVQKKELIIVQAVILYLVSVLNMYLLLTWSLLLLSTYFEICHYSKYIEKKHFFFNFVKMLKLWTAEDVPALRISQIGQIGLIWVQTGQIGQICQIGELTGQIEHSPSDLTL